MQNTTTSGNPAVKFGLIAGLAAIVYQLLLYILNPELLTGFAAFFSYLILIIAMLLAGLELKKQQQGFLEFKPGLRVMFLTSIIAVVIMAVFGYLLFTVIDPSLVEILKEKTVERTISWMEKFGAPDTEIEKTLERLETQSFAPTISTTMMNLAFSCIIGFILSAILAAIIKKNPPIVPGEENTEQASA